MAWRNTGIERIIPDPAPVAEPAQPIETLRAAWIAVLIKLNNAGRLRRIASMVQGPRRDARLAIDKLAAMPSIATLEFLNFQNHECRRLAAFGLVIFQI